MDIDAWNKRPARKQVDELSLQRAMAEKARKESSGRNIWTGKAVRGPQGDGGPPGRRARELSMYRCVPQADCGRTKGSDAKQRTFCLYFAKGCCSQGSACIYLHRIPTADDEAYHSKDMGADIFGREKRAEHEGFRKGAGTFERDNRTLYVNYEGAGSYELPKIRELMQNNFSVWGPIKSIYIVHKKTLAFVRYEWRSSAEFAKEAMHKQKLLGSTQAEILTCRWSNEDPNPAAVVQKKRDYANAFEEAAMASWDALPDEQRQARIMQLKLAASMRNRQIVSEYPNTDAQYGGEAAYPNTNVQYGSEAAYPDTDAQYGDAAAYPNTDAQYASMQASNQGGPAGCSSSNIGDPVLALCGGGEAALHPSVAQTLYPASDAHFYDVDQQLQEEQQPQQHEGFAALQGTSCAFDRECAGHDPSVSGLGLQGQPRAWQGGGEFYGAGDANAQYYHDSSTLTCADYGSYYGSHFFSGKADGGEARATADAVAAGGSTGATQEQAGVGAKGEQGDSNKEQGEGNRPEGLMGLLANYGSDDE